MADDIETLATKFCTEFAKEAAALHTADAKFPDKVTFSVSKNKASSFRTPEEQAAEVQKGKSWTCASSHMTDNARHVILKVAGTSYYGLSEAKELKEVEAAFKTAFGAALKAAGLKNYKGGDGFASGDEFHVELPETKLAASDKRVLACFDEYAKLTRKDGKAENKKFEKEYDKEIAKAVERKGLAKKK
ncbi:MAG: hypothetical protein ACT4OK_21565 [Gemmobacter sp.]